MDKILEMIKSQNFDMGELSKVLDVTKDTLAKMLDGKLSINTSQLSKIADFLKLDLDLGAIAGLADGIDMEDIANLAGGVAKKETKAKKDENPLADGFDLGDVAKLAEGVDAKDLLNNVSNLFGKK